MSPKPAMHAIAHGARGGGMDMAHMAEHRAVYVPASVILRRTRIELASLAPAVMTTAVVEAVLARVEAAAEPLDSGAQLVESMIRGDATVAVLFEQQLERLATPDVGEALTSAKVDELTRPAVSLAPLGDLLLGCSYLAALRSREIEEWLPCVEAAYRSVAELATLALALAHEIRADDRGKPAAQMLLARLAEANPDAGVAGSAATIVANQISNVCRTWANADPLGVWHRLSADRGNNAALGATSKTSVGVGERLRLTPQRGSEFARSQARSRILIGPRGAVAKVAAWSERGVSVIVPEGATTGSVRFARELTRADERKCEEAISQVATALGQWYGDTFLNYYALEGFGDAPHVGLEVDVRYPPRILRFQVERADGSLLRDGDSVLPGETVTVHAEGWSTDPKAQIVVKFGDRTVIQGPATGGSYRALCLDRPFSISCLISSIDGNAILRHSVRITNAMELPSFVTVARGEATTVTLRLAHPATSPMRVDVSVTYNHSEDFAGGRVSPHPTVRMPATLTIPAGSTAASFSVTGVDLARAFGEPAATAVFTAPNMQDAELEIWVEPRTGNWRIVGEPPIVAIHAALLHTGNVLFFSYDDADPNNLGRAKTFVWNPSGPATESEFGPWASVTMDPPRNLFCAGHCFLPDGSLLVAGGQGVWPFFWGDPPPDHDMHVFHPDWDSPGDLLGAEAIAHPVGGWERLGSMQTARWYPTLTLYPDGRVSIITGASGGPWGPGPFNLNLSYGVNRTFDVYDPAVNRLTTPSSNTGPLVDLYPFVRILPGGTVFLHEHNVTRLLFGSTAQNPFGTGRPTSPGSTTHLPWEEHITRFNGQRTWPVYGACILLPLHPDTPTIAEIMVVGGGFEVFLGGDVPEEPLGDGAPATDTVEIFEFDADRALAGVDQAGWTTLLHMHHRRVLCEAVLLPDGTVLVIGGAASGYSNQNRDPVLEAELFDPGSRSFRLMEPMQVERRYHSVALLLPDGRVAVAGSTGGFPGGVPGDANRIANQEAIEVFEPPYLYRGPRPQLFGPLPEMTVGGSTYDISLDGGSVGYVLDDLRVALIRPASTTHANDFDQRFIYLDTVERDRRYARLRVQTPPDHTICPPGYYMLFVINGTGVPSSAEFVHVS